MEKKPTTAVNNIDVWIGKRSMNPGGVSSSPTTTGSAYRSFFDPFEQAPQCPPDLDAKHWAIVFRGRLYHVCDKRSKDTCVVEVTDDERIINTFKWRQVAKEQELQHDDASLEKAALEFENKKYFVGQSNVKKSDHANCQTFVVDLLLFGCGFTKEDLRSRLTSLNMEELTIYTNLTD